MSSAVAFPVPTIVASLTALNQRHEHHAKFSDAWQTYEDLYCGGEHLRAKAASYLIKRQKEPIEVYAERVARVYYENYIGSIIDWYCATLFRTEPQVDLAEGSDAGFWQEFLPDVDLAGSSLTEFLRKVFRCAVLHRTAWVLVDLPHTAGEPANRAEQDAMGGSRAYLVLHEAPQVLDWREDGQGNLEWVKTKTVDLFRPSPLSGVTIQRETWTVYSRTDYERYSREGPADEWKKAPGKDVSVPLEASGPHALTDAGRVPLIRLDLGDGLWLANRAGLLALEHFQKSNALAWAIHMGLFAMPVIYSDREWKQVVGESYFIQLGPQDKFGWTEPEGKVFGLAAENLDRLKDEIYRVCYLMAQAGGREAKNTGQSGVSKAFDYRAVEEVLRALGSMVKDFVNQVLGAVALVRDESGTATARGLDNFDIRDLKAELDTALELSHLVGRASPTFARELRKRLAAKALDDVPEATKKQIAAEIDAANMEPAPEPAMEEEA